MDAAIAMVVVALSLCGVTLWLSCGRLKWSSKTSSIAIGEELGH